MSLDSPAPKLRAFHSEIESRVQGGMAYSALAAWITLRTAHPWEPAPLLELARSAVAALTPNIRHPGMVVFAAAGALGAHARLAAAPPSSLCGALRTWVGRVADTLVYGQHVLAGIDIPAVGYIATARAMLERRLGIALPVGAVGALETLLPTPPPYGNRFPYVQSVLYDYHTREAALTARLKEHLDEVPRNPR